MLLRSAICKVAVLQCLISAFSVSAYAQSETSRNSNQEASPGTKICQGAIESAKSSFGRNRFPISGTTVISLIIGVDGKTRDVSIETPSNYAALDQAAVICAQNMRYNPALKDGVPIEFPYKESFKWNFR